MMMMIMMMMARKHEIDIDLDIGIAKFLVARLQMLQLRCLAKRDPPIGPVSFQGKNRTSGYAWLIQNLLLKKNTFLC